LEYGYDFPRDILSKADIVAVMPEEIEGYESLKLQGRLSTADAEMIAICKQRGWLYITMDKVALRTAKAAGVDTADLRVLLEAIKRAQLLGQEQLRALIERMERKDRTRLPYKEALLAAEEDR
jgi:predicted nucleic acid-binding protein